MAMEWPEGTALVVGGSGGIGSAVALALAKAGSHVTLTYRTNLARAEGVSEQIAGAGGSATTLPLDITQPGKVDQALASLGALHTVVLAAGPSIPQPYVSKTTVEQWRAAVSVDLDGAFHVIRSAIPLLRASRGSVVHISSAGIRRHPPGDILSVAPKAGVEALIRAVAREEGRHGVRANAVAVGVVEAGMFQTLRTDELAGAWTEAALRNIPLRRFGRASEVAAAAVFLASPAASYITGQILAVDGGYTV
jgi:NAD(P)-dependent dehydrogenase (short-subunit alcohol dehydrogenase family)